MSARRCFFALIVSLLPAALLAQNMPAWQMQDSGTTASLRGIVAVNSSIAWASGTEGTVLRTLDGGQHWRRCATPDAAKDGASLDFRGVQAWDEKSAIVMASGPGDQSRLYKTTDGCASWTLVFANPDKDGFFDCLHLVRGQRTLPQNEGFGILLGDSVNDELTIFETRNGGRSWIRLHDAVLKTKGSAFAASNGCIANTNATNDFIFGGEVEATKLRLNYAGSYWLNDGSPLERSWSKVSVPVASGSPSKGPFAIGGHAQVASGVDGSAVTNLKFFEVIVGGDYTKPNEAAGTAAYTRDGGLHWTASEKNPHGYRSSVQWWEQEKLWITVGTNGSDLSRDDGRNWQKLDDGNWNALGLPFVVGPHGRIARLVEAGTEGRRD